MVRLVFGKYPVQNKEKRQRLKVDVQVSELGTSERIRHRIYRRMKKVEDRIETLEDGTRVLRTKEFAELIGIPKNSLFSKLGSEQENYVYNFVDGTQAEVRCARGIRNWRLFLLEDAIILLRTMYQKEYELILARDMAQELRLSPGTILSWFRANERRLIIELDGKEHIVTLHEGKCSSERKGGNPPMYMYREEYNLFAKWIDKTYKGERTWQGHIREVDLKIPEKHVSVEQAGELLGEDRNYVEAKITSGKIYAEKLEDRIWAISLEEVERFRQERERKKPPAGWIPVWKMLRRTGINRETYKTSLTTSTDQCDRKPVTSPACPMDKGHLFGATPKSLSQPQVVNQETGDVIGTYAFLGNDRKRKEYRVHYDIEGDPWIKETDSNEIQKQMEERKQFIGKEETAKILGLTVGELRNRTDAKNKVFRYWLPDGTLLTADYIVAGKKASFRRPQIETIAKADAEFKEKIVYGNEIAEMRGFVQGTMSVVHLFCSHKGTVSFTLNGKNHEIKLRKERRLGEEAPVSGRIYLFKEEAEVLATWRGINDRQTHLRLGGERLCRQDEQFRRLAIVENRVLLHTYGFGVDFSVKLDELDGELYVRNEHVRLVEGYVNLHSKIPKTRAKEVETVIGELAELNPKKVSDYDTVKLLMIAEVRKTESDPRVLQLIDAALGDEKGKKILRREITNSELVPETVEVAKVFGNHPKLFKQLIGGEKGFARAIPLLPELDVYVPIIGDNGTRRIKREGVTLVELAIKLLHSEKGVTLSQKIDAAEEFLGLVKTKDQRFLPGLLVIGDFLTESKTSEETEVTTEDKVRLNDLFTKTDRLGSILARIEDVQSEYIIRGEDGSDSPIQGDVWDETIISI